MKKIPSSILVPSLLALVLAATSLPAHAQPTVNWRPDKSAYAPGDSGTLTLTIFNTVGNPLAVRNITVYYPWAGYDTNGEWVSNANITNNFSPPMALATTGANNFSYTTPQFTIPSWWGSSSQVQFGCPATTNTRLGRYSACILVGTNNTRSYNGFDFTISMALPFYNPSSTSILSEWIPVAELIVLVVATALLALIMLRLGNPSKKA
ncbi:MAG TPA: hypothetical protein VNA15_01645 [Candidatus Angelobacter sp.]|nr:hypothetical protein [Candidatus Angelobacter sp.]